MDDEREEEAQLRSVALQSVQSILQARQRAEYELVKTKEALEEETRILELLNKTGAALASRLDLTSLLQEVTDAGTQLSGAQFGAFFYKASQGEHVDFKLYVLSGAPREAFEKLGHPGATHMLGPTFRGERVVRIADVCADPRYGQLAPHFGMPLGHLPVRSYLAAPVVTRGGEVLGGLFFGHREPGVFTERSERLIVGIAGQAAVAIDNARLYESAKRSADERAQLLEAERAARSEQERIGLMKDEFLATLSHELRTPLHAVLGWSTVLLAHTQLVSEARRGLETIERNARAQAKLIDDLLEMNRIVSGKVRLEVQRVELASIIESSLESVATSLHAKAITLRRSLEAAACPLLGDPNRLQQVVWNLVGNAVKFTPDGGTIEVTLRRIDAYAELTVRDSGIGIEPQFLPCVFERFRQADSSITRRFGGLGLGLSIVKQLVELHGGTVRADSAGKNQGASFIVRLPVRVSTKSAVPPMHACRATEASLRRRYDRSLAGASVLVVDDETDARELVRMILSDVGAAVITAGSADQALRMVETQLPDVIVSDIGMPGRDGYQFIHDVRSLLAEQGGKTPAIALTAFARAEDRTRATHAGYQVHVAKPIEPQKLIAAVGSLVPNRQQA